MTAEERIHAIAERLAVKFEGILMSIDYKANTGTYFIKVIPNEIYESELFAKESIDLIINFGEDFPEYSLAFVKEDSIIEVDGNYAIYGSTASEPSESLKWFEIMLKELQSIQMRLKENMYYLLSNDTVSLPMHATSSKDWQEKSFKEDNEEELVAMAA